MYGLDTRRGKADAPTEDEVMKIFTEDKASSPTRNWAFGHAVSLGDIAAHVWWGRGGQGDPKDHFTRDETPRVSEARVRPVVDALVLAGKLLPVSETENYAARRLVATHPRRNATYYALGEQVRQAVEEDQARVAHIAEAEKVVSILHARRGGEFSKVGVTSQGAISVVLTPEQAVTVFDLGSTR